MRNIDYKSFNNGSNASEPTHNKRWWLLKGRDLAQAIAQTVQHLSQYDSERQEQYQTNAKLYGNMQLQGFNGRNSAKSTKLKTATRDRVTFNLVQSVCDTIKAKMIKNKPKPDFLTNGGNYKVQRKAKKLNQFIEGIFYEQKAYEKGADALLDAEVMGDGFIKVFCEHDRVKWQRTLASNLFVDNIDGFERNPRQMHELMNVDREAFAEVFSSKRKSIMQASGITVDSNYQGQNVSDQITVVESFHLPSGPDSKDGLHCICIENDEIFREEWNKDHFPYARLPWAKRMFGFWSQGIPEQVQSLQLEANKLSWVIQRSMHLAGSFKIWTKIGSKIPKEHFNNAIGAVWESEVAPQYIVPPIVPPEIYQRLKEIKQDAFEQVGVSQLSANSQKPAGLNSGKALREFNDIESDRFTDIGQMYENFFLQLAALSIDVVRDIYSDKKEYEIKMPGKRFADTVDWKDIDLEDDQFVMKMFPVSSLPNEPAGRLQTIQEYIQAGFISPRAGRRLLNFPDLDQYENLQDSQENYIHKILGEIVDGDGSDQTFTAPEPDDDLQLCKELVLEYIAEAKDNDLEQEKLKLLRTFNEQVDILVAKANPPPPQMGLQGQPQANPEAAPVSDLLPNAPGGVQ